MFSEYSQFFLGAKVQEGCGGQSTGGGGNIRDYKEDWG